MFVSFIIAVYNCEQYLQQCIDTIYDSTLATDDFEVVLVDDGSTDRCSEICRRYVAKKSNVQYIHQRNRGPATARNTGLDNAHGEYVWFVDADDRINPEILLKLKNIVESEKQVDLISFGYVSQFPDCDEKTADVDTPCRCSGIEYLRMPRHGSYLWNNIYRRAAIGDVRMLDGVSHIEDYCFNLQTIIRFERVIILPDTGYCYNRCNLGSISHDKHLRDRIKANADSFQVYNTLYQEMCNSQNEEHRAILKESLNFNVNAHIYTMMKFDNVKTIKRYISLYRQMGLYPVESTGNRKGDLFRYIANCPWLLFFIVRYGIKWKRALKNG